MAWTPLTLRRRMQLGCSAMAARYSWRVSSSSARWRQGGIRRVHRKGPATAYARKRGVSSGAQNASRPSCARCGFGELGCTHQCARSIPCVLMHVARDLSKGHIRSALGLGLGRTCTAVAGARAINDGPTIVHRPGRPEKLTVRADVDVTLPIEGKVGARQDALFSLAHVPNRDVRRDAVTDNPMEEFASAVGCVSGEPFGLEPQSLVRLIIVFVAATSS